jgi:hypothetical protein
VTCGERSESIENELWVTPFTTSPQKLGEHSSENSPSYLDLEKRKENCGASKTTAVRLVEH